MVGSLYNIRVSMTPPTLIRILCWFLVSVNLVFNQLGEKMDYDFLLCLWRNASSERPCPTARCLCRILPAVHLEVPQFWQSAQTTGTF